MNQTTYARGGAPTPERSPVGAATTPKEHIMNRSRSTGRRRAMAAAVLVSGGLALGGLGLAAGIAHADPGSSPQHCYFDTFTKTTICNNADQGASNEIRKKMSDPDGLSPEERQIRQKMSDPDGLSPEERQIRTQMADGGQQPNTPPPANNYPPPSNGVQNFPPPSNGVQNFPPPSNGVQHFPPPSNGVQHFPPPSNGVQHFPPPATGNPWSNPN